MQALRRLALSARGLFAARQPSVASFPMRRWAPTPVLGGTIADGRGLMTRSNFGLMGGLHSKFALGPVVQPWLAPQMGVEQTRGMRHGQRRGKLGLSSKKR